MGHSWNDHFFCAAGASSAPQDAVNVVVRGLSSTVQIDEFKREAVVDAGVIMMDLLDYLGKRGWTLPAIPWWVGQTVGGAVATATHGSSVKHGSLSSQVVWMEMVLANGTLVRLDDDVQPALMRAARVSVGRLGIIVRRAPRGKQRFQRFHRKKEELLWFRSAIFGCVLLFSSTFSSLPSFFVISCPSYLFHSRHAPSGPLAVGMRIMPNERVARTREEVPEDAFVALVPPPLTGMIVTLNRRSLHTLRCYWLVLAAFFVFTRARA